MLNTFNDDKVRDSGQKTNSRQKVREFCSTLSWNPNSFLELGPQDPPLFAGLESEEMERLRSQTVEELNTDWGGAAASCHKRAVGPVGTGVAATTRPVLMSDVRGFSLDNIQGKQVLALVDFSTVMEVDDDEDEDWEE